MKKVLVSLCVIFLVFGIIGCKEDSEVGNSNDTDIAATSGNEVEKDSESSKTSVVPEPASLLLIGSGLFCLIVFRRRMFFKNE